MLYSQSLRIYHNEMALTFKKQFFQPQVSQVQRERAGTRIVIPWNRLWWILLLFQVFGPCTQFTYFADYHFPKNQLVHWQYQDLWNTGRKFGPGGFVSTLIKIIFLEMFKLEEFFVAKNVFKTNAVLICYE